MTRWPAALMLAILWAVATHAGEGTAEPTMSITISPFHLLCPEIHLTGEWRLTPELSAVAVLGAGQVTDERETFAIWEVGGQFRYYLLGSFTHGMMLGIDAGYIEVDGGMENPMAYLVGSHAGAVVGYKIAMQAGYTMEVQIGPVYVWADADNTEWQTLLNLKIGWTF